MLLFKIAVYQKYNVHFLASLCVNYQMIRYTNLTKSNWRSIIPAFKLLRSVSDGDQKLDKNRSRSLVAVDEVGEFAVVAEAFD